MESDTFQLQLHKVLEIEILLTNHFALPKLKVVQNCGILHWLNWMHHSPLETCALGQDCWPQVFLACEKLLLVDFITLGEVVQSFCEWNHPVRAMSSAGIPACLSHFKTMTWSWLYSWTSFSPSACSFSSPQSVVVSIFVPGGIAWGTGNHFTYIVS